ncbi:hypothetical protein [Nonomuraea sp. NPDC050783]|uniref:hypothetical protein n=1 Tax=Nonomuraea sp. NPDC050783 TaxID=3154634 RepID=UPI0034669B81
MERARELIARKGLVERAREPIAREAYVVPIAYLLISHDLAAVLDRPAHDCTSRLLGLGKAGQALLPVLTSDSTSCHAMDSHCRRKAIVTGTLSHAQGPGTGRAD